MHAMTVSVAVACLPGVFVVDVQGAVLVSEVR